MHTQNTHGWSTLQEGSEHYLYRPVSSMGFNSIESMVQALQDCQNPAIAIPEITRLANGDIYLKEPRGIRSVEDFLTNAPSTRAKLFVVQQLVKLLENLHTFVGVQHGDLHLGCLSIDTDNKLILGGITPSTANNTVDVAALQNILQNMFPAPSEADVLSQLQSTSLKKMRGSLKNLLVEDTWDEIQSDWSTAVHQTSLEESSEELPVEDNLFDDLDQTMDIPAPSENFQTDPSDSGALFDLDTSIPVPNNFHSHNDTSPDLSEGLNEGLNEEDWENVEDGENGADDWDDVDLEGWLDEALPEPASVEFSSMPEPTSRPVVNIPEFSPTDTITPEMFGDNFEDDWFTDLEETLPLPPKQDLADKEASRQTHSDLDEVSDFEDDEANDLTSFSTPISDSFENSLKRTDSESTEEDPWFETDVTERLDSLLTNDLENNLEIEANTQQLDDFDEFDEFDEFDPDFSEADDLISDNIDLDNPTMDDEDFSTDVFSRSSLFGTLDIPLDTLDQNDIDIKPEQSNTVKETTPDEHDWFADTTSSVNTMPEEPLIEEDAETNSGGIPKWVLAASAVVVAGGAYAATQQQTISEPAVFVDEGQVKGQQQELQPTPTVRTTTVAATDSDKNLITTVAGIASTSDTTNPAVDLNPSTPQVSDTKKVSSNEATSSVKETAVTSKKTTKILGKSTSPSTKQKARSNDKNTIATPSKLTASKKERAGSPFAKSVKPTVAPTQKTSTTVATLPMPKKAALPPSVVEREAVRKPAPERITTNKSSVAKQMVIKDAPTVQQKTPIVNKSTVTTTTTDPLTVADSLTSMVPTSDVKSSEDSTKTQTASVPSQDSTAPKPMVDKPIKETVPVETKTVQDTITSEQNELTANNTEPKTSLPKTTASRKELTKLSTTAVQGKLSSNEIKSLQSIDSTESTFTRANAIVLTHGQQSGNVELIEGSLSKILSVDANMHKPVFLLAMAQHQFNQQNLDEAREYLMQAEVNWANVERSQLAILRAQRDNIVAHLSYISFMETGSEDSRLQSLTQFRKVQREARRAKLRSLFEQAESKMQMLQRNG